MARVARHVRATGRVQGVFFRAWTREQADRVEVSGWVRNCSDGSVEAHLEGSEDHLAEMIELMRRGPAGARVDELHIREVEPQMHDGFGVQH